MAKRSTQGVDIGNKGDGEGGGLHGAPAAPPPAVLPDADGAVQPDGLVLAEADRVARARRDAAIEDKGVVPPGR